MKAPLTAGLFLWCRCQQNILFHTSQKVLLQVAYTVRVLIPMAYTATPGIPFPFRSRTEYAFKAMCYVPRSSDFHRIYSRRSPTNNARY